MPIAKPRPSRSGWLWAALLLLAAIVAYRVLARSAQTKATESAAARSAARSTPVGAVAARKGSMPVVLNGLGSVTAFNTVTVKSRVDGQLVQVAFQEGQVVDEGDLLAEIDPRPFEVQLAQAEGQMARDQAQLRGRDASTSSATGTCSTKAVHRQAAARRSGRAGRPVRGRRARSTRRRSTSAKLQLTYSHVTAPISGRIGLRLVDVGNIVHATDPTGLLVITQVQPIAVLFTIPEDDLRAVLAQAAAPADRSRSRPTTAPGSTQARRPARC